MRFYKNLIYKYYRFAISIGNEGFYPEVNAFVLATIMVWFNFLTLIYLAKYYSLIPKEVEKFLALTSTLFFWIVGFIYIVLMGKYKAMIEEFETESEPIKKRKTTLITCYSVVTIAVYFYVAEL